MFIVLDDFGPFIFFCPWPNDGLIRRWRPSAFENIIQCFMNDRTHRSVYNSTRFCWCSSEANLNFQKCNNPRLTTKE